ncbi:hypothetical protein HPB50_003574 [Hyalomma asiaticum]|uniref:Uncharacterized protein n=1 Tax=Hyalomma asiaticum TaxID=266040 RepID=A0ACB7SUV4_HYAAI|nr:hypothetical protein HPB50_003574 [Hyalomma asiaticum]
MKRAYTRALFQPAGRRGSGSFGVAVDGTEARIDRRRPPKEDGAKNQRGNRAARARHLALAYISLGVNKAAGPEMSIGSWEINA